MKGTSSRNEIVTACNSRVQLLSSYAGIGCASNITEEDRTRYVASHEGARIVTRGLHPPAARTL